MAHARSRHQATLRLDGSVLVVGSHDDDELPLVDVFEAGDW